ncbi:MAG: tryptophanase [Oscillospiraceae bacterium]|nr:tryptophanase [Oscillospiraceae bacterium]
MAEVKFYGSEQSLPLEMHKVRIIQKLNLLPIDERVESITDAGNNTFLLKNRNVFLDMLTDSGTNAMSDRQLAAMMTADDSYAGSETFYRLEAQIRDIFGMKHFLPAHQGRACENLITQVLITKPDQVVPMNYHFTTAKAHISRFGAKIEEIIIDEGLKAKSDRPFKGDINTDKLRDMIKTGKDKIAFVRIEAGTNLIGGQPVSMNNFKEVSGICRENGIVLVVDASLLADNLYFIKTRDADYKDVPIIEIMREIGKLADIIYFSARKLGCARGGGICLNSDNLADKLRELVPLFEGFLTYGGMSVREMEALTVGLGETLDMDMISQAPQFIGHMVDELSALNIPVVTPAGGLGCHLNAKEILPHVPQSEYPAGALASALYIISGIRGMERGTMSEQRNPDGSEPLANMELVRLALPRRVFTLSQIKYTIDRVNWLYQNRDIVGGIKFTEEPRILRFFFGRLAPVSDWQEKLVKKFKEDFGDSL